MKQQVMLLVNDDKKIYKLPLLASVYNGLAVHKSFTIEDGTLVERDKYFTWDVSHVGTGLHIDGCDFSRKRDAVAFAKALSKGVDLDTDSQAEAIKRILEKYTREQCLEMRSAARVGKL